jgi:hypothetical protein
MVTVTTVAGVGGIILSLTKRFMPFNVLAWTLLSVGLGLTSTLDENSSRPAQYGFQVIMAIGGGIIFTGRLLAVQTPQKVAEDIPIATTLVSFFTSFGQSIGIALGGTIFQNVWTTKVNKLISKGGLQPSDRISAKDVEGAALGLRKAPSSIQAAYAVVVSESLKAVWLTLMALSTSAFLATLLQRNLSTANLAKPSDECIEVDVSSSN